MVTRLPATFFAGPAAVEPPGFVAEDVLSGLIAHVFFSLLIGTIYAALLPRLRMSPVAGGLITGGVLYALGFWLLPQLFPHWIGSFWLPPTGRLLQVFAHAVYGLVLEYAYRHLLQ